MQQLKTKQNIPSGWKVFPIGKYIKLQGGNAFSASNYVPDGIPLVRIGNVGKGEFDDTDFVYISEKENADNDSVHLKENDILMGMTGELGKVAQIKKQHLPAALNQRVGRVVFRDKELDPDFTFQVFLSSDFKSKLEKYFIGAAQKNISSSQVESIEILFPPTVEQQKIAEILGVVDEDISKTEEVIRATEKLKKGLMQQLFTRGIGHTKFKETKIGQIPEEWEAILLDVIAKRGSGHTPNKKIPEYYDGGIKWISLADSKLLDRGEINKTKIEISEKGIDNSSAVLHQKGTVLLSRDAGIGKSAVMAEDMAVSQHFITWACGDRLNNWYLYYYLQFQKSVFERIAMGSTIKTIGLDFFKKYEVPLPPIPEQQKIADIFSAVDEKISVNKKLKERLILLKKGLMQDLLSGKVRVRYNI